MVANQAMLWKKYGPPTTGEWRYWGSAKHSACQNLAYHISSCHFTYCRSTSDHGTLWMTPFDSTHQGHHNAIWIISFEPLIVEIWGCEADQSKWVRKVKRSFRRLGGPRLWRGNTVTGRSCPTYKLIAALSVAPFSCCTVPTDPRHINNWKKLGTTGIEFSNNWY